MYFIFGIFLADGSEAAADAGLRARHLKFGVGQRQILRGPILSGGITQQSRYFPSLCDFKFTFAKNPDSIHYIVPTTCPAIDTFALKIYDAKLKIKRIRPYPQILASLEAKLNDGGRAFYPINNIHVRHFIMETGLTYKRFADILVPSYAPKYLILGLMEQDGLQVRNFYNEIFQPLLCIF